MAHTLIHTHTQPPKRCIDCRQFLDDPSFKVFIGDPENAVRHTHTHTHEVCLSSLQDGRIYNTC